MAHTQQSKPQRALEYLQLSAALAAVIAPLLGSALGIHAGPGLVGAYIFLGLLGAVSALRLWHKAVEAYNHKLPLPLPGVVWRILFNKLPPSKGRSIVTELIRILVIHDASTKDDFEKLSSNFQRAGNENNLELVPYEYPVDLPKKNVMAALEESQAVYLFLGQEIGHDKDFQNDINLWSEHETQKPILVVKSDNQPYTLPFDKIPHREATTGLWRLLSRSIERTTLWYDQATTYRKVWLVTLVAALVLVALSALLYHRNARLLGILNQRDQSIQNQHQIASRDLQKLREVIKIAINNPDVDYSPAFSAHELKEAPELIDLFKKGSDPASKILRGRFQPTTIELLDRYDQEQPLGNLLVNALVTDLNQILGDPSLQKTPLVHSNEEIQKAIASDPKGTDLIWLNRMIMEEAYPNRIKPKSKTYLALKKTFQDALNNYALYSFNELVGRMAESQDGQGHLSFWRLSPDGAYYQQVGRSHPGEEYRVFPNTRNPIVKCAIENDAFVFWGAEQNDGDEAGWNLDGKVIGWWSNNNVSFDREYAVPRCGRVGIRGDDKTTGLLCVGVLSQPRDMGIRSAACIDVPYRNVDFLKEPGARNYLLQTVSVMHIIPNELLNFNPNPKISKDILPDQ